MYFIVNITKPPREITIADINFSIGPNKAIDLEKVRKRSEIEDSQDLKRAIKARMLEVRHTSRSKAPEPTIVAPPSSGGVSAEDIQKIRDAVKEEMKAEMRNQIVAGTPSPDSSLMAEMLKAMQQLQKLAEQGALSKPQATETRPSVRPIPSSSDDISDSKLAEIHARTMANRMKNTTSEGNINYEQTSTKDDVLGNLDDLDGLVDG